MMTPDEKDKVFERIPDSGGMLQLKGHVFGELTVIRLMPARHAKKRVWLCQCSCGAKPIAVRHDYLLHTHSPKTHCGCKNRGLPTQYSQEYHIWNSMLRRCNVSSHVGYPQYGGRGIKPCPQWADPKTGFETFLKDVGPRPSKGHSLDRVDPNGNYEPIHSVTGKPQVVWATATHQARNKRNSIFVIDPDNPSHGKIPAAELAERWKCTYQAMRARMIKMKKWPGQYVPEQIKPESK